TAISLSSIRRRMGWPPLDAPTARRLDERLREARRDWSSQPALAGLDLPSHAAAIVGILSGDVAADTTASVLELLEHCASLPEGDLRTLPRALRLDARPDRLRRVRPALVTASVHRSAEDVRTLWPVTGASPTVAL